MGFLRRGTLAFIAGLSAAGIVGCGSGGGLLSSSQAAQLTEQLNAVSQALADGHCTAAENDINSLLNELSSYGGVNSTLLDNLTQGVNTIQQLTQNKCTAAAQTTTRSRTTTTRTAPDTTTTATNPSPTGSTTNTGTLPVTTSTNGGQPLPTITVPTSTNGGSPTGPGTTSGTSTTPTTATGSGTTPAAAGSGTTTTSQAGGATGF